MSLTIHIHSPCYVLYVAFEPCFIFSLIHSVDNSLYMLRCVWTGSTPLPTPTSPKLTYRTPSIHPHLTGSNISSYKHIWRLFKKLFAKRHCHPRKRRNSNILWTLYVNHIRFQIQAQPIDPDLTAKLLGRGVAVSPIVTVEPRRRKFHKAITLSMPAPKAHSQGMINQYSGNAPTLRLLCSITGTCPCGLAMIYVSVS